MNCALAALLALWRGWWPGWLSEIRNYDIETWAVIVGFVVGEGCIAWLLVREAGER